MVGLNITSPSSSSSSGSQWLTFDNGSADTGTWTALTNANYRYNTYLRNDTSADADAFKWTVYLPVGTYSIAVLYPTATDAGIMDAYIDATKVINQQDHYAAAGANNVLTTSTGIAVTDAGLKTFKIIVNGKNAASTDYWMRLNCIWIWRTA